MNAAKKAFSAYLQDSRLNPQQIYFLNRIVEYIVKCGIMTDLYDLQATPFTDQGNVVELFSENKEIRYGIRRTSEQINENAKTA